MITDIDRLMAEKKLDAIIVTGPMTGNPIMYYLTGGAKLTGAVCVKIRGEKPVLLHGIMEREEAARTGLETRDYYQMGLAHISRVETDPLKVQVRFYENILSEFSISGRVAFYGNNDISKMFPLLTRLASKSKDVEIVEDYSENLFEKARTTKSPDEIEIIKSLSHSAGRIIEDVRARLAASVIDDQGKLHKEDGSLLTIDDMKRFIRVAAIREGLVEDVDTIFAIGRDAGIPHSSGNATDVIECGKSIVFDFFPRQIGGGYFFDVTRTFCIARVPDKLKKLYDDVLDVQERIIGEIREDTEASQYQRRACELFRDKGYVTTMDDPRTTEGYVHNLGHGLGLDVHEKPFLGMSKSNVDRIVRGSVFTIEPGLYFPDRGMGVRIEDVLYIDENGEAENLSPFSKELLIR